MSILRCPVTRSTLTLQKIKIANRQYDGVNVEIIEEGFLFGIDGWFYPLHEGIPRLNIEAIFEYKDFFEKYLSDYNSLKCFVDKPFSGFFILVRPKKYYIYSVKQALFWLVNWKVTCKLLKT